MPIDSTNQSTNSDLVYTLIAEMRSESDSLTVNQKLFAALILRNLQQNSEEGKQWILASLGFSELPCPSTPIEEAVWMVSAGGRCKSGGKDSLIASVALLKAVDQYDDLMSATDFLLKASNVFARAADKLLLASRN